MAFEHSIVQCFSDLCDLQIQEVKRAHILQPKVDKKRAKSRLKKKLFDTLFTFLNDRDKKTRISKSGGSVEDVKTQFWWFTLCLRQQRRFDDANHLEELFKMLTELNGSENKSDIVAYLQFLLKLRDTGGTTDSKVLGHQEQKLPVIPKRDQIPQLPDGPLLYGDTQLVQAQRFHYMHYPRCIFEAEPLQKEHYVNTLFDATPGTGLKGRGFFSVDGYLGDVHEKITSETLFGGLVQGRVTSLDIRLDLPELPDETDSKLLETRIPKSSSFLSADLNDEGFKSQDESVTSSTPEEDMHSWDEFFDSAFQSDYDTAIYEDCLKMKISQYYTWETLGLGPGPRMKPFLTEAGPYAFDQWIKAMLVSLKTSFPAIMVAPRVEISQSELVREILNVMIAVPSVNFILDLTDQCFTMRDGLYVTGMTSEGLQDLLDEFLACGMYYYRLNMFSAPVVINSFYEYGLTFQAFTGAVQVALQHYRACVLSIPQDRTLLQLRIQCHKLIQEMRFLAQLCQCDNLVTQETKDKFPKGIHLISFIYKQTLESSFSDHYPLMLSLLKHSCTPYLIFVQDWVFHGVYKDQFGEFMIEVNYDYLQFKDKHYWTQGYTLTTDRIEESVPLFLKDMANDVFVCGKSINLLKLCNRNHFVCNIDDLEIPRIVLTFSQFELDTMKKQCASYASKMQEIARQYIVSRREKREQAERAKQDLINKAKQETAKNLQRLQDKMTELRRASDAKKRQELKFLKSQMEQDLKRRAKKRDDALQKDKEFMDKLTRKEGALEEEELELERQAREDLIAYYSQLSAEAAHREQKALWRVRRAKLELARNEFFMQQERQWAADMQRAKSDPNSVTVTKPVIAVPVNVKEPVLPRWAQRGLEGPTIEVSGDDEETEPPLLDGSPDKNLPKWAIKGLQRYGIVSPGKSTSPKSTKSKPVIAAGRKTPVKRSLNASFGFDQEEEEKFKPSIQTYDDKHATMESKMIVSAVKPGVKFVKGHHANLETSPGDGSQRYQVKPVGKKHATMESESQVETRPHIRPIENQYANKPSAEPEHQSMPKLKPGSMHLSTETQPLEWKVKPQSEFGHVSQTSSQQIDIPKIKKSDLMSATKESLFSTDYSIKPRIRMHKSKSSTTQSTATHDVIPKLRGSSQMSATKESEYVDMDLKRVQMFKERNVYGHAADSTVQKLLYQGKFGEKKGEDEYTGVVKKVVPPNEELIWTKAYVEPYLDKFDFLDEPPKFKFSIPEIQFDGYGCYTNTQTDIEGHQYLPLSVVIGSTITGPLHAQISLVNESVVNYFIHDLQLEDHFHALRRYLCMADGDFSEILCDILMEKLGTNPRPQDIVNPVFLNNCLSKAIRLSINADDKYADNLSFLHKYVPKTLEQISPDLLDCLELHYEVKWPLNIVITEDHLDRYLQVFSFMLQLKRVVWILKDVWHRLKRDAVVHKVDQSSQFRQLHLYRQEMQHFVKVMQEYISFQIINVTWQEFQTTLEKHVHNLDDLHNAHTTYLDTAVFRCLLSKNATALMKIIQDIFCLILKFHRQLLSNTWYHDSRGAVCHKNFTIMKKTYKAFVNNSRFLFKVVRKLAFRGYEPHLHDLLLRLNFNNYYDEE